MEERIWRTRLSSYQRPFATRIGVRCRSLSRLLRRVLSDFGADHSFATSVAKVKEHYGFEVSADAVRQSTFKAAGQATQLLSKDYASDYRALPAKGADCVIAEVDGSMICTVNPGKRSGKRPRQWREIRLAAAQAKDCVETFYAATFGDVDQVGRRWGHCVKAAGRGLESDIHCVADGAGWIPLQSDQVFGNKGRFLCDFFHVSEYLSAAAVGCRPHDPNRWRRTQHARLRRGASKLVVGELEAHLEPAHTPEELAPVRAAHRYLSNRLDCLDYPGAIARDLPIGSGLVESGHRHVLQSRLKIPGSAWLLENAQSMAQLRVLRSNRRWHELWN